MQLPRRRRVRRSPLLRSHCDTVLLRFIAPQDHRILYWWHAGMPKLSASVQGRFCLIKDYDWSQRDRDTAARQYRICQLASIYFWNAGFIPAVFIFPRQDFSKQSSAFCSGGGFCRSGEESTVISISTAIGGHPARLGLTQFRDQAPWCGACSSWYVSTDEG